MLLDFLARHRLLVGHLYLLFLLFWIRPTLVTFFLGTGFLLFGEVFRTWASGYLYKNQVLVTTGPYSIIRNPLYFGSFFMGLGVTLFTSRLSFLLFYFFLFLAIYLRVIVKEERSLLELFPEEGKVYFSKVPRFLPFPHLYKPSPQKWSMDQAIRVHREWVNWVWIALYTAYAWSRWEGG